MTRAALHADLQGILGDAAQKFSSTSAYDRHLDLAALALARKIRVTRVVKLTVVADVADYPAPTDMIEVKYSNWGESARRARKAWEPNFIGLLPRLGIVEIDGERHIHLSPAPTACQIAQIGSDYPVFYYGTYVIGTTEAETTVPAQHRDLLLIRATVQALMELANSGSTKPVSLGSQGVGSMPKNGTPAALAESWLAIFDGGR